MTEHLFYADYQKSTLQQVRDAGITRGGLYGFFVKGEGLVGSINEQSASFPPLVSSESSSTTSTSSSPDLASSDESSVDESDSTTRTEATSSSLVETISMAGTKRKAGGKDGRSKVHKRRKDNPKDNPNDVVMSNARGRVTLSNGIEAECQGNHTTESKSENRNGFLQTSKPNAEPQPVTAPANHAVSDGIHPERLAFIQKTRPMVCYTLDNKLIPCL